MSAELVSDEEMDFWSKAALVNISILFVWLFTIKNQCKKWFFSTNTLSKGCASFIEGVQKAHRIKIVSVARPGPKIQTAFPDFGCGGAQYRQFHLVRLSPRRRRPAFFPWRCSDTTCQCPPGRGWQEVSPIARTQVGSPSQSNAQVSRQPGHQSTKYSH